jgi:hypothetical protein
VKECSLDINLLEIPVQAGSKVQDGAEQFKASCQYNCFLILNTILLGVAFCNIADFVMHHLAIFVLFLLTNKLPF